MAKIGDIYLGGAEGSSNQRVFNSGIGFFLEMDSKISNTLSFENGKWEVELKEGQQSIIARCTEVLPEDQILDLGFKYCQQAIDLLSVKFAEYLSIQETGNFHILLYKKNDKFLLKQVQTAFSTLTAHAEAVVVNTITGNIVPQPAPQEPKLTPGLRYYRLSQNANDLYEAYRNAFLSFEYLLNDIHPIRLKQNGKPDQGERDWYKEALKTINSKVKLIDFVPKGTGDPIEYLVISQYDNIRCKLFHAKGVAGHCQLNIIIPADTFNRKDVSNAYVELMILLNNILKEYYNIKFEESGITYSGFKLMMENNLSNGCLLFINSDNSPINGNLIERCIFPFTEDQSEKDKQLVQIRSLVSPKKFMDNPSLLELDDPALELQYDINDSGTAKILGELDKSELCKIRLIHRTSLLYPRVMFRFLGLTIFYNEDGIHLSGIDKFESIIYIKLKNKGDPQK